MDSVNLDSTEQIITVKPQLFKTVRVLKLRQTSVTSSDYINTLIELFIGQFQCLHLLKISAVYNPITPLQYTKTGQVQQIRLIIEKRLTNEYFSKLYYSTIGKGVQGFYLQTVLQDSQIFEAEPLSFLATESSLSCLEIKNLKGFTPIYILEHLAGRERFTQLRILNLLEVNFDCNTIKKFQQLLLDYPVFLQDT